MSKIQEKRLQQAEINIGMVGHVDHGKTMLTKALTGVMTDTHSEELKRGISIRLGYADAIFRKCPKCKGDEAYTTSEICKICGSKTVPLRRVSFVDAPGHETLMATMLSGAALLQGAVLVIAANEKCPQPRTAEHLAALKIAGVKNIVVAQNKIDLVNKEKALENYNQIKKFLSENGYENAPVIPTSATYGVNIDFLIAAIERTIPTPEYDLTKPLKMYVVRSFDINRPGTKPENFKGGVLGGSIMCGKAKAGEEIEIAPGFGKRILTQISSLSTSTGIIEEAHPGGLIAIGTPLDPRLTRNDQMRGQIVAKPGILPAEVNELRLELHYLDRLLIKIPEFRTNDAVIATIGTATNLGIITNCRHDYIEIKLKMPAIVEKGQKIALSKKTESGWRLAAYGKVL